VFSVATHGLLVSAAMALVSEITLPPPPETFKWDVSVVQTPAPPEERVAPPPPPVQPPPPEPQPVRTPTPPKRQPVRTEPVVQAPPPVQEIKPVQENRPVETAQPVQDTVPVQTAQPIQQVTQQQVTTVTQPIQEETRPSPEVAQTVTRTEAPVETTETVEQQAVTAQPVVTAALTPTVSTVTERSVVEDSHTPVETPQMVEQTVSARAAPEVQQRAAVQHMAVRSRPNTQPDYGWLSQALWATVEQRKRYPQEARRNRWEGRVILRLTIEQRGAAIHLLDVSLEESSGHTVLDRHTLDMVRKAFPLDVKHTMAQRQVLHMPFSYRME